jgi:hypothetical protein
LGANTVIGRHGNGDTTYDFAGIIDDVRVYNYALSDAEILDLYGRLLHWKLNESSGTSAADASPFGRTGTVTGTSTWTAGMLNNAFQFNGSTKIQVTGLLNSPKSVSAAAWVNLTTADSAGSEVISIGDHFVIRLDEGGAAKALVYNGSTWESASFTQTFAGTGWHHLAATFDYATKGLKLYIDGVQAASATTTTAINYSGLGSNTLIGRHGNAGTTRDFTGLIDDVRIYGYVLSATDIATLYGFVGHWKLAESSGTTAADSTIFAKNGTVTGGASWSTRCDSTGVFNFNGSTHYISVTNGSNLQPTEMISIAAWIKADAFGTADDVDMLIRKGDTNPNNYQLAIADGKVALYLDDSDTVGIRGNTTLVAGQWYHVAATWDGANVRIYVNGVLDNTPAARSGTIGIDTRSLYMGGRSGGTDMFDGHIQDIRLYNRSLTAAEVAKLAALNGYWKFSEGSGTSAADSSGVGGGATLSGGASWTTDCGGYYALQTNGTGGVAQTAAAFMPPAVGTVAFWMKSSGSPAATARIFGLGDNWEVRQTTDGKLAFDICGDGTSNAVTSSALNEAGRWYHVVETFNSADETYAIYIDGVLNKSGTNSNAMTQQNSAVLSFGTRTGTTDYWPGGIREFRIYGRRLCAAEISQLYNQVGSWKLDETTGTVAADASLAANNATYTNGVTLGAVGPLPGSVAATFDGVNDYVDVATETRDYSSGFSVTVWARPTAAGYWARFIDFGGGQNLDNVYFSRVGTTTTLEFAICDGTLGGTQKLQAANAIVLNEWHHYAATVNSAGLARIYKDSVELASGTVGLPLTATRDSNFIGRSNWGTDAYYQGKMWDVRVYNRCLCPTEIQAIYNAGSFDGVKIIKWIEIQ